MSKAFYFFFAILVKEFKFTDETQLAERLVVRDGSGISAKGRVYMPQILHIRKRGNTIQYCQ